VIEGDWLVGIVTLGDLWAALEALEARSSIFEIGFRTDRLAVMQIMTQQVVTVSADTSIKAACELMLKHEIGALPVITEGRLEGIVTESDIFRLVARRWSGIE
jgi:acetoin utilization protein AcuB